MATISAAIVSSSHGYTLRIVNCDICDEEVDYNDAIVMTVHATKDKEDGNTLVFHKHCYLNEPEAVKSLIILEDLT